MKSVEEQSKKRITRWALAGLSISMLMPSLDTSIANSGLPTLATAFAASFQQVQWIVLAYLLAITTLIVSVGRLADLMGRRKLLLVGIATFTIASTLCGLAPSLWVLNAARAAQGIGAATMLALTLAFVGETVPKEKIGSAMGLLGTMSAVGTALGPSLGGILISGIGWRFIFLVNIPVGILAFVLAHRYLPVDQGVKKGDRVAFDTVGTIVLALTLGAYALAMTVGRGRFGALNVALIAAATAGAILFVFVELRTKSPLLRLTMFRDGILSGSLTANMLVSTVIMATLVVGPFYLSLALGLGAAKVGMVLSVGPIVVALAGVPAGRIVDRFGAQYMTVAGLGAMTLGSVLLALTSTTLGIVGYLCPLVFITAGYSMFQTSNNAIVMTGVLASARGVVSGMLSLSRNLGLITGASAMGAVFALASGATEIAAAHPQSVATGMRLTFVIAATLTAVALAITLAKHLIRIPLQPATNGSPIK